MLKSEIRFICNYHQIDCRYSGNDKTFYLRGDRLIISNIIAQIHSASQFKAVYQNDNI